MKKREAEKKCWDYDDNEYDVYIEWIEESESQDVGFDYPVIETNLTIVIEKIKLNGSNRELMKRDIDLDVLIGLVEDTIDMINIGDEVKDYYDRLKD